MKKRESEIFWNVNVKCLIIKDGSINYRWWEEQDTMTTPANNEKNLLKRFKLYSIHKSMNTEYVFSYNSICKINEWVINTMEYSKEIYHICKTRFPNFQDYLTDWLNK